MEKKENQNNNTETIMVRTRPNMGNSRERVAEVVPPMTAGAGTGSSHLHS